MSALIKPIKRLLRNVVLFAQHASGLKLRVYQEDVALTIVDSVIQNLGLSIVVIYPRQSGKNELQAQVETYLLILFSKIDAEMVKISPTWKPQTLNAMRRLERVLERNLIGRGIGWKKESGYIFNVGKARIFFLSGGPTASIVGATASTLLEIDEAQDVLISKYDKEIAPMAASTNATRVFWGTAWTSQTLLAREKRAAMKEEAKDGIKRVFKLDADMVAVEVPEYGKFVGEQVAKLGRNHPMVKTQYYSEEIDAEGGLFPPARMALMQGDHEQRNAPKPGRLYALLVDVAGEDEGAIDSDQLSAISDQLLNKERDSTAVTVVEVDLATLNDELINAPTYRVMQRHEWVGKKHTKLYGKIKALFEHWNASYIVVDATGVGAGLYSFLDSALPGCVIPYVFTAKSKSGLGWGFLAVVESGRYKEYRGGGDKGLGDRVSGDRYGGAAKIQEIFWKQVENCQSTVLDGPGKMMRWGVPEGTRDVETGDLVHDDLLISAAMCWVLDDETWGRAESAIVEAVDPLKDLHF